MPKQTAITRKAALQPTSPVANEKRKRTTEDDHSKPIKKTKPAPPTTSPYFKPSPPASTEDMTPQLSLIAASTITPFQKRVLTALCQVPPGHYTTYGALSKYLSSSPRAVGNALRRNPFAPEVPCHRVLASGGGLGGFMGSWGRKGEEGKNDGRKLGLLEQEGVVFEGGKVKGGVWEGFR